MTQAPAPNSNNPRVARGTAGTQVGQGSNPLVYTAFRGATRNPPLQIPPGRKGAIIKKTAGLKLFQTAEASPSGGSTYTLRPSSSTDYDPAIAKGKPARSGTALATG
eukprot:gene9685-8515_t